MNDYKELIEILRDDEFYGRLDFVYDAADAIERLVKERDSLMRFANQLGKRFGPCDVCGADCPGAHDIDYQNKQKLGFHGGDCSKWEWRGVRKEQEDEEGGDDK